MPKDNLTTNPVNVCARCGREQYGDFDDTASTTHGICEDCFAKKQREYICLREVC